jgi:hypothetical protein
MAIIFPEYPVAPLFPAWESPVNGIQAPVYAWHAFTAPNQRVSGSLATPRPLSDIPAGILAMVWYNSPPGFPERRTMDYGKGVGNVPYTFHMPDGTTRVNSSNLSQTAFNNLVTNLWAELPYPP